MFAVRTRAAILVPHVTQLSIYSIINCKYRDIICVHTRCALNEINDYCYESLNFLMRNRKVSKWSAYELLIPVFCAELSNQQVSAVIRIPL